MEELSGKVQKAITHVSFVGIDIAVVERDCATVDADATSVLPNKEGARFWSVPGKFIHRGDGKEHGGVFGDVCSHIPAKARVDQQNSVWVHSIGAMG